MSNNDILMRVAKDAFAECIERLKREVIRLRFSANLDDRAAERSGNYDAAQTFRAWALAKRERASDIELALSVLADETTEKNVLKKQIEELTALRRDYETLQKNYSELLGRNELLLCQNIDLQGRP